MTLGLLALSLLLLPAPSGAQGDPVEGAAPVGSTPVGSAAAQETRAKAEAEKAEDLKWDLPSPRSSGSVRSIRCP